VYADVLNKPVLVPAGTPTSLGSGIFAFLAAGTYGSIEEAQKEVCLLHKTYEPNAAAAAVYDELYALYRKAYFALGTRDAKGASMGEILPKLRELAEKSRQAIVNSV
ncbi:MAG: ribulokinase, partial [Acidobacteriota bacterium]